MKKRFFYGYVVAAASFAILVMSGGVFNTFGVFVTPLQGDFGWTRAAISVANSLGMVVYGMAGIAMGGLADHFGPRAVTLSCGFLVGLGCLLMARLDTIWQLYLGWSIVGIGHSATDVVLLSTISRWFVKRRGTMSGIVKMGTGVGMLIVSLVEGQLIATRGWRAALLVLAISAFVFIVPISQLLRRDPAQMRQLPDNGRQEAQRDLKLPERGLSFQQAVRTSQFWIICAVYLAILVATQSIMVHIVPHATDIGISATSAAAILSTIGASSIIGRLVMAAAVDKFGSKRMMIMGFVIMMTSLSWLLLAGNLWALYLFAVPYGFAHGGFFSVTAPMTAEIFGTRSQGILYGIVIFAGTIGGFIGPIMTGYMFDVSGSYQWPFMILVAVTVVGLLLMTLLRPMAKEVKLEAGRSPQLD